MITAIQRSTLRCILAARGEDGMQHLAAQADGVPAGCSLPVAPPVHSALAGPVPH